MVKKIWLSALLALYCGASYSHNLIFLPKNSSRTDTIEGFLSYVQDTHAMFRSERGRDPRDWNDFSRKLTDSSRGNAVLDCTGCRVSGTVLTADAVEGKKKVPVRYIMMNSGGRWMVHSENSGGLDNWAVRSDHRTAWRWFADEKDEKNAVDRLFVKIQPKNVLGFDMNLRQSSHLAGWRFYCEYSFYKLLPVIADQAQLTYYRMSCVEALKNIPDPVRFAKAVQVIDGIIGKEKSRSAKDDAYHDSFITSLGELKALVAGGR